jgi:hypothetical protein
MRLGTLAFGVLVGIQSAWAHYKWPAMIVDGAVTPDYKYVRVNTNNINPIMDLNSTETRCDQGGLDAGPQASTVTVQVGSTVSEIIEGDTSPSDD